MKWLLQLEIRFMVPKSWPSICHQQRSHFFSFFEIFLIFLEITQITVEINNICVPSEMNCINFYLFICMSVHSNSLTNFDCCTLWYYFNVSQLHLMFSGFDLLHGHRFALLEYAYNKRFVISCSFPDTFNAPDYAHQKQSHIS